MTSLFWRTIAGPPGPTSLTTSTASERKRKYQFIKSLSLAFLSIFKNRKGYGDMVGDKHFILPTKLSTL